MRAMLRTVGTPIAAIGIAISIVTVARAELPDCKSQRLTATQLAICYPGLFGTPSKQPRSPFDTANLIQQLSNAYSYYIDVKQCHEAKLAFGLFASDLEVERARNFAKRIEQLAKYDLDPVALDIFWTRVEVTKRNRGVVAIGEWRDASGRAPVACKWGGGGLPKELREQPPDSGRIVKDF